MVGWRGCWTGVTRIPGSQLSNSIKLKIKIITDFEHGSKGLIVMLPKGVLS
jgi:hypothetical protein